MRALRASLLLLGLSVCSSALAGRPLTGDSPIDSAAPARAPGDQGQAAIAFGAGNYFVVWIDSIDGNFSERVVGARLSPAGQLLDSPAIVLRSVGLAELSPAVAFDGKRFLVVWREQPNGQILEACYFDPNGLVVGPAFALNPMMVQADLPAVAAGDGFSAVAWQEGLNLFSVHAALLDDTGNFIGGTGPMASIQVSQATMPNFARFPSVTWSGPGTKLFGIAWEQGTLAHETIQAATLDTAGNLAGPYQVNQATGANAIYPTIANDGTQFFAIWSDARLDNINYSLFGRIVPLDITKISQSPVDFVVAQASSTKYERPLMTWTGSRYLAMWESYDYNLGNVDPSQATSIFAGRFDSKGAPLDGPGELASVAPPNDELMFSNGGRAQIASDGNKAFGVWTDEFGHSNVVTGEDVFALPFDPSQAPSASSSLVMSVAANYELGRSAADNGDVELVVWEDNRGSATLPESDVDIWGVRVSPMTGKEIEAPFLISSVIGGQGQPIGAPGNQFSPYVAASVPGGDFLVVWSDGRTQSDVLDPSRSVELYGATVGSIGQPSAPFQLPRQTPPPGAGAQLMPVIAGSPNGWLVAWEHWANFVANDVLDEIHAMHVGLDGKTFGPEQVIQAVNDSTQNACAPSVAWTGTEFFVAYEQPCSLFAFMGQEPDSNIYGRWVDQNGIVKNGAVTVANTTLPEVAPSVAANSTGTALMVWEAGDAKAGAGEIRAATLADGMMPQQTLPFSTITMIQKNILAAPSVTFQNSGGAGTTIVTWIESDAVQVLQRDASLGDLGRAPIAAPGVYLLGMGQGPLTGKPASGTGYALATQLRSVPQAPIAFDSMGGSILLHTVGDVNGTNASRLDYYWLGTLPLGAMCTADSECLDGFCAHGSCCDAPCDAACQQCGTHGCVDMPPTDDRCGIAVCAGLSTTCRTFKDNSANQCVAFGQCYAPASLDGCTSFVDNDTAPCESALCAGGGGSCMAGQCVCNQSPEPTYPPRPVPSGCTLGGRSVSGGTCVLLSLLLVALVLRRRR